MPLILVVGLERHNGDDSQITTWITRELPKGVHNIDVEAYFLK